MIALASMIFLASAHITAAPTAMRGTWGKNGRCDKLAERLTITRHTAGWGKGPFFRIYFDAQSGPTIFWDQEGVVDNFVMGGTKDVLVHNTEGFGMPGQEGYARCGPRNKRVAWPTH